MTKSDRDTTKAADFGHGIHIVGGGLTGYAAALALAEADFPVTVYQSRTPNKDTLRTTTINPSAYDMLKDIGVIAALPADALTPIYQIMVTDDADRDNTHDPVMSWDNSAQANQGAALAWVIGNAVLSDMMEAMLAAHDRITVCQTDITGYQSRHPDYHHAAAALMTADDRLIPASLIIAADGRNSKLRQAADIRVITRNLGQSAIVSTVTMTEPHRHIAWQKFLAGGPIALMPMPDMHMASLVWSMTNEDAERLMKVDDERFAIALDDATDLTFGRITDIGVRQAFAVIPTHALWPVAQRLVLIGDAAHAINPLAGQGYNLALADVKALARMLMAARRDGMDIGSRQLLHRYAFSRTPEIATMTLATDGLNMLFSFGKRRRRLAGMGMALANLQGIKSFALHVASGRLFGR